MFPFSPDSKDFADGDIPLTMIVRQSSFRAVCTLCGLITIILVVYHQHQTIPFFLSTSPAAGPRLPSNILDHVDNSTFGFEKIFVVGLPSRTDRRDGMVLQAAVSNIEVEFIDGVRGDDVPDKAIPSALGLERPPPGLLGSWRAHMNAIREIVHRNISSALIFEDDVDWDVRIRDQLRRFALSAQALTQPLADYPGSYADPTYPQHDTSSSLKDVEIPFNQLPKSAAPRLSPYGDSWDLLWLGHCGMQFPPPDQDSTPQGRVVHLDDETAPERRYLYSFANPFTLVEGYPEHTRAVHHVREGVCSLAYAVTQKGARRLLNEVGLRDVTDPFDILLRYYCEGAHGRGRHLCLTSQPALFNHRRPAGPDSAQSDIGNHGDGRRDHSMTDMIRWSTRLNADVLMDGGSIFHDQYPDAEAE